MSETDLAEEGADEHVPMGEAGVASSEPAAGEQPDGSVPRAARLRDLFLAQADRLIARLTSNDAAMNKTELDAINALSRLADRLDALAAEDAAQRQERSDEQVAKALAKISARIVYLARKLATQMVEQGAGRRGAAPRRG